MNRADPRTTRIDRLRAPAHTPGAAPLVASLEFVEYGQDTGRGNLVGVQPYMTPEDYASSSSFTTKIGGYLAAAAERRWLQPKSIIIFPEMLGTWLVAVDEAAAVYHSRSLAAATRWIVLRHPLAFLRAMHAAREQDRTAASLFRLKAERMAQIYGDTFGRLARQFAVTIVAGSIVLPGANVEHGRLIAGAGPLHNVAPVFGPDGSAYPDLVRKVFPIDQERPFIQAARLEDLPVFNTPAGCLGVLICADSWYPSPYATIQSKGATLLAVPSYLAPDDVWSCLWNGYNGAIAPDDIDLADVHTLTEGEAWLKYAFAGRSVRAGLLQGVNVFLRGQLWDLGTDGYTVVNHAGTIVESAHRDDAVISNLWLS